MTCTYRDHLEGKAGTLWNVTARRPGLLVAAAWELHSVGVAASRDSLQNGDSLAVTSVPAGDLTEDELSSIQGDGNQQMHLAIPDNSVSGRSFGDVVPEIHGACSQQGDGHGRRANPSRHFWLYRFRDTDCMLAIGTRRTKQSGCSGCGSGKGKLSAALSGCLSAGLFSHQSQSGKKQADLPIAPVSKRLLDSQREHVRLLSADQIAFELDQQE
ncbi:hypothetical protein E6O75_ATG09002 [Venturia nashicola]|uniref:Uncharacterized protein n=1 Tax=Venturia nashicola TaxID=86259 RepID=A0A4Z1NWX7_9PEZI|nr:hypothetical protein E6O75_ATG09002 [Venturia nashicola]